MLVLFGCGGSGNSNDRQSGDDTADDDADDDLILDDDTSDDDAADDDASDDDAGDDDASDDDAGDDDASDDDASDDDASDDDASDDDASDDDASDDDASDDDTSDDDTASSLPFSIDFESYDLGDLPSSWYVSVTGATTIQVVNFSACDVGGKALEINDGTNGGDHGDAEYLLNPGATGDVVFTFDVFYAAGAFGYAGVSAGDTSAAYLALDATAGTFSANDYSDPPTWVECGSFAAGASQHFEFDILSSGTYSVKYNGASTVCTDLTTQAGAGPTYTSVWFSESATPGQGGIAYYDNITGDHLSD